MQKIGNVQSKIACIFESQVLAEKTTKRSNQSYRVVACDQLRETAINSDICTAYASEKLDGTCCYVAQYRGEPWLWARHDRKPNKSADKRFKKFQSIHREWELKGAGGPKPSFQWNASSDFKEVPDEWIAASGVELKDAVPQPDENGHIPGWVPVQPNSRQHCWHLSAVDLKAGIAIVLQLKSDIDDPSKAAGDAASPHSMVLEVTIRTLEELVGCTLELIGTMVNGNPYSLGSKKQPIHMFVPHGAIPFLSPPPNDFEKLKAWFEEDDEGQVEGIVWNCSNGSLFKVHRHHLDFKWPVMKPRLHLHQVEIHIKLDQYKLDTEGETLFTYLSKFSQDMPHSIEEL